MQPSIIATHIVKEVTPHTRLQEYAVGVFDEIPTKSSIKKAIKKNRLMVNGKIATTAQYIHAHDVLQLLATEEQPKKVYRLDLNVVYEDDYLSIIEKPSGVSVSGNKFSTLQNALGPHISMSSQTDATFPHAVHRLDYATSGLLIIGKTATSRRLLHQMFQDQQVQKTYHAVTVGKMLEEEGTIETPLEGKPATTYFKVLKSLLSDKYEALNLVKLNPETGRTHQLRKHLLSIGHPIMGDQKYFLVDKKHKGNGLYLHASVLSFTHPILQNKIEIESVLPKKFRRLFGDD